MSFRNFSILQKIGLVVFVMGLSSLAIALVGARGIASLESALVSVGAKEEVARQGDTVFIAPNENREIVNRGSGVCTLLVAVAAPPAK